MRASLIGLVVLALPAGGDILFGTPGRDELDCGPGKDYAMADGNDRVRHCGKAF